MREVVAYPAILDDLENQNGVYTVIFPDVPAVISQGNSVAESIENGSEALGLALYDVKKLPKPSSFKTVEEANKDKIVTLIASDLNTIKKSLNKAANSLRR